MTKGKQKHPMSVRLAHALSAEHAGQLDFAQELEQYLENNPDDKWAIGQLRYSKKRITQLEKSLGLAKNRNPR